jgi:predicted alternative tryptophan synthase beta-subunit
VRITVLGGGKNWGGAQPRAAATVHNNSKAAGTTQPTEAEPKELASLDSGVLTAGFSDAAEVSGARS